MLDTAPVRARATDSSHRAARWAGCETRGAGQAQGRGGARSPSPSREPSHTAAGRPSTRVPVTVERAPRRDEGERADACDRGGETQGRTARQGVPPTYQRREVGTGRHRQPRPLHGPISSCAIHIRNPDSDPRCTISGLGSFNVEAPGCRDEECMVPGGIDERSHRPTGVRRRDSAPRATGSSTSVIRILRTRPRPGPLLGLQWRVAVQRPRCFT